MICILGNDIIDYEHAYLSHRPGYAPELVIYTKTGREIRITNDVYDNWRDLKRQAEQQIQRTEGY